MIGPQETPTAPAGPTRPAGVAAIQVSGKLTHGDIPALCRRVAALLHERDGVTIVCDVSAVARPDLVAVDALARLRLAARRAGGDLRLANLTADLRGLLEFAGLADALVACPELVLEARRKTEKWEEALGVEKEGDAGDGPI